MEIINKVLTDAYVLKPMSFSDDRGVFKILFNSEIFNNKINSEINFVQDNLSISKKNVFRGFHFQKHQFSQSKLVWVSQGSAIDIILDLRPNSPTFMKTFFIELSKSNSFQLFIPRGFAHGFISLEENTMFQYKVDNLYSKEFDSGINPHDTFFNDLPFNLSECITSQKDEELPLIKDLNFKTIWEYKK